MVGIVVVSHSDTLAEGVVRLAREMASPELALEAAGGLAEPGALGTDVERVRAAIERAMSPDGVLVLMDLGSALMSAEFAVELLDDATGPVRLSDAPLVEGAVAAAVAASGEATLDQVAAEARSALAMKVAILGAEESSGIEVSPADGRGLRGGRCHCRAAGSQRDWTARPTRREVRRGCPPLRRGRPGREAGWRPAGRGSKSHEPSVAGGEARRHPARQRQRPTGAAGTRGPP